MRHVAVSYQTSYNKHITVFHISYIIQQTHNRVSGGPGYLATAGSLHFWPATNSIIFFQEALRVHVRAQPEHCSLPDLVYGLLAFNLTLTHT